MAPHLLRALLSRRALLVASSGGALTVAGGYYFLQSGPSPSTLKLSSWESRRPPPPWTPPTRDEMINRLKASGRIKTGAVDPEEEFDLLVIGGGATGAGVAVDAASRGLKVALVERDDFGAGTSSKSTKLVHGGVRYLQKAVMELDYEQYKLVKEALHERRIFLETAPYLSAMLPIMLPIYQYWQVPYYYAGCKMYDLLAGKENMHPSYLMSKNKALETFPMLKSDGLVGAVVYYDGQHNDSRMNAALVMTAVKYGATVANYVEVTKLLKDDTPGGTGKLNGAKVKDELSGDEWIIRAKGIVNATGPFSDSILSLANDTKKTLAAGSSIPNPEYKPHKDIVQPSSGVHITLPNYYSPRTMGLLDPATSDGRVIFFLPWQGATIAGTTDTAAKVQKDPAANEDEIRWVLDEVRHYLSPDIKVRRGDVLSAWSGLRPLVRNPAADPNSTQGLVRNHMVYVGDEGLLTIAGGKWTTYRKMAEETVDKAVEVFGLEGLERTRMKPNGDGTEKVKVKGVGGCVTEGVRLVGSDGWSRNMFIGLIQRYGIDTEVAKHLSESYGDRAWTVCELADATGVSWPLHGVRLHELYPYIEAEVRYAVHNEYACRATDVIARRTRLSFLNAQATLEVLPRVVDLMAIELGWGLSRKQKELHGARVFLESMGLPLELGDGAEVIPRGLVENVRVQGWKVLTEGMRMVLHPWAWWAGLIPGAKATTTTISWPAVSSAYSRAKFEIGELAALKSAFEAHASIGEYAKRAVPPAVVTGSGLGSSSSAETLVTPPVSIAAEGRLAVAEMVQVLKEVPGYEEVKPKELDYVIDDAGFKGRKDVGFEEFIEICGDLKEISFTPTPKLKSRHQRKAIPVEKSGGGV